MTLFMFVCIYFGIWNRGISCIGTHDEGYTGKKNPLKLQHPLAPDETSVCVWNKRASLSLSLTYRRAKSFFLPSTLVFLVSHQLGCSVRGWKRSIITRLSADWSATVARSRIGLERSASPLLPFWELPPPPSIAVALRRLFPSWRKCVTSPLFFDFISLLATSNWNVREFGKANFEVRVILHKVRFSVWKSHGPSVGRIELYALFFTQLLLTIKMCNCKVGQVNSLALFLLSNQTCLGAFFSFYNNKKTSIHHVVLFIFFFLTPSNVLLFGSGCMNSWPASGHNRHEFQTCSIISRARPPLRLSFLFWILKTDFSDCCMLYALHY